MRCLSLGLPWADEFMPFGGIRWTLFCASILLGVLHCAGGGHPTPAPTIEFFDADDGSVEMGSEVHLEARFANGTGVVDHGGGVLVDSGRVKVAPVGTTTYTLTVTSAGGQQVQKSATVAVNPGLAITVEGPGGRPVVVTVAGPNTYSRTLTQSCVLTRLPPGAYTITAEPVKEGDSTFHPWRPRQRIQVQTGTAVRVNYPAPTLSVQLPGGVPMDFVLIPAGSYIMGSDHPADPQRFPNPSPAHPVRFDTAFYMAKFPTTQAQWTSIVGDNPSFMINPGYAVSSVSFEAVKNCYLPKLNSLVKGYSFRLPSESEWEYACRAGTNTTFFYGNDSARGSDYAWSMDVRGENGHVVGQKAPNPWGLYDLAGLVFQWCDDVAHDGYVGAPSDGATWFNLGDDAKPDHGIIRGYPPLGTPGKDLCGSSAERWSRYKNNSDDDLGFRLVCRRVK